MLPGGLINDSSSDIYLFLFNPYLQQSIIHILEFLSLCHTSGCFTTKRHKEKQRVASHLSPDHSYIQIPPSVLVCLLERPIPWAWKQELKSGTEMKMRENFLSTVVILDLVIEEYKTGGVRPHYFRWDIRLKKTVKGIIISTDNIAAAGG